MNLQFMAKRSFVSKALVLMMIVALLFVTACGSKTEDPGTTPTPTTPKEEPSGNEDVNLSIMWWGPDARHEATLAALDIYTEQNPNVTWTPEYLSWDAFWAKLPTLAASKTMTDVLQMDAAFIHEYVSRGALEDLSDIDLTGIVDPNIVENLKIDGKLYGIPLSHNAQGFAYNKTYLDEYGIEYPKQGWTWDDYFAFARDAHSKLPADKYPIVYTNTWDGYQYYQTAMGKGEILQDGGATFNLDKDSFMEFYRIHEELRAEGVFPPADLQASFIENDPQADPVASGKVMLTGKSVGSVSALELLMPGQMDVVNIPVGPTGKGGWAQATIFLAVGVDSKHKDTAKDFVKWFITDPDAGAALAMTRGIPINDAIFATMEGDLKPEQLIGKKLADAAIPSALPFYPLQAGYTEFRDLFEDEISAVMFGQQSVEKAYENINKFGMEIAASK